VAVLDFEPRPASEFRISGYVFILRAAQVAMPHANNTTLTELSGIRTAHTTGDKIPAAAILTPAML
jgi:hypothetical protein